MNRTLRIIVLIILAFFPSSLNGQNIFRFDHIGSEDGLSLNTGFSILFDSKGFMWVGTYNGLNRYDGYEFKIFRSSSGNPSSFTNNRVIKLWEDKRGFIWRETYDGYYHFFNPVTEVFHSIPLYEGSDVHNGAMKFFLQYSTDIIFLGSSESATFGLNLLEKKDIESGNYRFKVFLKNPADDKSLIYNDVIHIFEDSKKRIWLGTFGGGIDLFEGYNGESASFRHYGSDAAISYGIIYGILEDRSGKIWFSTENGLVCLDPETGNTEIFNNVNGLGFNSFSTKR
jgi:hypothetical protein